MYVLGLIDRVRAWEVAHCGLWICFGLDGGDLGLCRGGVLGFWTHMVPAVSGLIVLRFWLIVSTVSGFWIRTESSVIQTNVTKHIDIDTDNTHHSHITHSPHTQPKQPAQTHRPLTHYTHNPNNPRKHTHHSYITHTTQTNRTNTQTTRRSYTAHTHNPNNPRKHTHHSHITYSPHTQPTQPA